MADCIYKDHCRFYRKHQKPDSGTRLTRQLHDHYCASGRSADCAILRRFVRTGDRPPKTLLPDGGRYVDAAEIYVLGAVALLFTLFALLLVTFCSFR